MKRLRPLVALAGVLVASAPAMSAEQRPQSSISVLVDLSQTWHNSKDDPANELLLSRVGEAVVRTVRSLPMPVVVRYHAIGTGSFGRAPLCSTIYSKRLFGFGKQATGTINDEDQLDFTLRQICPRRTLKLPVEPDTEIAAAIRTAADATRAMGKDSPRAMIILSDFKEDTRVPIDLSGVDLRKMRVVMIGRVLPEDRRLPLLHDQRIERWRKALRKRDARVENYEETTTAADIAAFLTDER